MDALDRDLVCDTLQRYFLCCRRVALLPWRELEECLHSEPSFVLKILQKTILHPLCQKHPPSLQYRRLFLSELIKKHESTGADPLDELYNALADVLNTEENTLCYKTYFLSSSNTVTLSESTAIISEGTTGLVTWEAALQLADWSIENMDIFKNKTILELGSGIGLTGIAICKSCFPKKYIFSDYHPHVLKQLKENIRLNGHQLDEEPNSQQNEQLESATEHELTLDTVQLSVIELDWESVTEKQLLNLQADVVIASDVVYDPEIIILLSKILHKIFSCIKGEKMVEVFIASTIRNPETYNFFQTSLGESGLNWQVIPAPKKNHFSYDINYSVEILKITLNV
ncbi:protein-lysine N-methyltransferase EEF2KMT [Pelodytes ibericus]